MRAAKHREQAKADKLRKRETEKARKEANKSGNKQSVVGILVAPAVAESAADVIAIAAPDYEATPPSDEPIPYEWRFAVGDDVCTYPETREGVDGKHGESLRGRV